MTLLLDSNVLIDLTNDNAEAVRAAFQAAKRAGADLRTSPMAIHEVVYGALISARPLHQNEAIQRLLRQVTVEPLNEADAHASARIRAERKRLGRAMAAVDSLIAGQAVTRGCGSSPPMSTTSHSSRGWRS